MKILKSDQYITIPRDKYEKMEEICNSKKDIKVHFAIYCHTNFFGNKWKFPLCMNSFVYDLNSSVPFSEIEKIEKSIEQVGNRILDDNRTHIKHLETTLTDIKAKWWYKLFS